MPSPDETFYNLKRLHLVFAVSSLALLAVTLWTLAADHWREWKVYQQTYRDQIEPWLADHHTTHNTFPRASDSQQPSLGKRLLRLPLVDAFGRPLAIEQIWLPELTINYNFRQVARFDRCVTCHQAIDKTMPGSPSSPACLREQTLTVKLRTPQEPPKPADTTLQAIYGLSLAHEGILAPGLPTIGLVLPLSAAAKADLLAGDIITKVNETPVSTRDEVIEQLLHSRPWGKPLSLEIRRGLPLPYRSHPRLNLFAGTASPHPIGEFGCTICHAGQGSATSFKFASHTPNNPKDRARWRTDYGWFWNHDWDFPMRPSRFLESSCLKCHHDVVDLEPTQRFPDPPAPKLLAGYHLVRQNGCFACHEIRGVTATGERLGPDMRLEPNYHEAAQALLDKATLTEDERRLAHEVVQHPEQSKPRRQLAASLQARGNALGRNQSSLVTLLATDDPLPGTMRKVGPSLRESSGKLDRTFLNAWTWQPSHFRPETRMPQFFGQYEHLAEETLANTRRFEAVEVQAVNEYLLAVARPAVPLNGPQGITEQPSAERGKRLFEFQGCLACHKHNDFPEGQATQGPDLSNLGAKLTTPAGATWLASWLRDPTRHLPRTLMPNPMLAPTSRPAQSDPVADLAAYLLSSRKWQPQEVPSLVEADLDALAVEHLSKTYPKPLAQQYLREGIPASMADEVQGDALELVGPITQEKKIRYVGRRTIRKRGCYGCHDIPGFEAAPLIGPALSDWGRKQESLLAFEQVHQFLAKSNTGQPADTVDSAFFTEAVRAQRREGFLWQKLGAPRSYDYQTAQNKGFNEQLLMGRFTLSPQEREAIITFVLGLVAEPPTEKYVAKPDHRRQAIVEGRKVLDKYGCALCHTLEMERWTFQYDPTEAEKPVKIDDFAFLAPTFSPAQLAASTKIDRRGLGHAEVVGMPRVDAEGKLQLLEGDEEDEHGDPLPMASFTLWEPAAIDGQVWRVGGADLLVYQHQLTGNRAPWGGDFARLLYPKALADAKAHGSSASEVEAWGWVPPPLAHEGSRVQPAWLYNYLLAPTVIRPAAVLRMPTYNLSTDEAGKLVDYFAGAAGAESPYSYDPRSRSGRLEDLPPEQSARFDRALRLLTDRTTYCAKCHLIGDFSPGGENRTILAPNLDQVSRRVRPEYVRRWLANPKSVLPYTAMPVNFPPTGNPMGQDLYPGSSLEQLDAVTDLLLNYDSYMQRRTSIRTIVEEPSASKPAPANGNKQP